MPYALTGRAMEISTLEDEVNSNNLVPGNLFMNKDTRRCFMMVDNRSFAIGGESGGDVNKRVFMEIMCAGLSAPTGGEGGLYFDALCPSRPGDPPSDVVFMDASIDEQDVIKMNEVAYGALFMHEGLGEVLVKSILRAGKYASPSGACLCARAKDGQLVILPDGDKVVSTKVVLREVPDQELVDRGPDREEFPLSLHSDDDYRADYRAGYYDSVYHADYHQAFHQALKYYVTDDS